MKKTTTTLFYLAIALLLNFHTVNAQNENSENDAPPEHFKNKIGIAAGVLGFNLIYTRKINDRLSARVNANFFDGSFAYNSEFSFGGKKADVSLDFKNNTVNFDIEYLPFKSIKSLKCIVGLNYLYKFELKATTLPITRQTFGDIDITPDQIGYFQTQIKWTGVQPYVGIGYEKRISKQLTCGVELGSTLIPTYTAEFYSTGVLTPTSQIEQDDFISYLDQFIVLPNLKVLLSYQF